MFYVLTDNGTHWTMCSRVGTELDSFVFPEIQKPLQPLLGTTSAGT